MAGCPVKDDPKTSWPPLCPNIGAAYFFLILFLLTTCAHFAQCIMHRKVYSWVIIMSGIWQTLAYAFRIASIKNYKSSGMYTAWFVLILLAPLWTNAYAYMVLGRMIYNFTASARIWGIPAWRFGLYFVLLDVVAFVVQASGASMASGDDLTDAQIMRGLHIYMGGMGIQLFFILVFLAVAFRTRQMMIQDSPAANKAKPLLLLNVLFAILVLIIIRIVFRLVEYSDGYNSGIPVHEAYQYSLDSLPMFIALVLLNIVHPGRIMPGPESNLPSRKSRKALGKENVKGRATAAESLPLYGYDDSPARNESDRAQKPPNVAYTSIDAVGANV